MTFLDGSRVTPGTEKCMCDSPTPRPDGQPRDCEFPCWQRICLTDRPCCPDCQPWQHIDMYEDDDPAAFRRRGPDAS